MLTKYRLSLSNDSQHSCQTHKPFLKLFALPCPLRFQAYRCGGNSIVNTAVGGNFPGGTGGPGSIPGQGTRSHMRATTKELESCN